MLVALFGEGPDRRIAGWTAASMLKIEELIPEARELSFSVVLDVLLLHEPLRLRSPTAQIASIGSGSAIHCSTLGGVKPSKTATLLLAALCRWSITAW